MSLARLENFATWFLKVCLDQLGYMSDLFELGTLAKRLDRYVALHETLSPESTRLLQETLVRGEIERGEASRITQLPERTARRVLGQTIEAGLLASATPKGPGVAALPQRYARSPVPAPLRLNGAPRRRTLIRTTAEVSEKQLREAKL